MIITYRRLEKQKNFGARLLDLCDQFAGSHQRCSKNDQNLAGAPYGGGVREGSEEVTRLVPHVFQIYKQTKVDAFACLGSSHGFLNTIFGIMGTF